MAFSEPVHDWRTRIVGCIIMLSLCYLIVSMWKLQIRQHQLYDEKGRKHSMRVVSQPGLRGRIIDANGQVLAENRASHCIAIYMSELRQDKKRPRNVIDAVEDVLDEIAETLGLERTMTRKKIQRHFNEERFRPLLAWKDLDQRTLARYAEKMGAIPGVDIYTQARRVYPQGELACHVLGYVGRGKTKPETLEPGQEKWLWADEMKGREGLERVYNKSLRGEPQEELLQVDVGGYHFDTLNEPEAVNSGADVVLTLNSVMQRHAETILGEDVGAICIVSPQNGDVLALASYPRYDLRRCVPYFPTEYYNQLNNDKRRPFGNKAIAEHYAPGSTFKPLVALAAMKSRQFNPNSTHHCDRVYHYGGHPFGCTGRHGNIDMRKALETSCNIYFYKTALAIKYDRVRDMGREFGLGKKSGIGGLPEAPGLMPSQAEIRQRQGYFAPGTAIQAGIGQGEIAATPLQMTMATAALANGGNLFKPRLVSELRRPGEIPELVPVEPPNELDLPGLDAVRQGMRSVVYGDRGTARRARIDGMVYAGKTGTAQFGRAGLYRGWMIAFAPYNNPRVAITVLVEETPDGSKAAADKMKVLLESIQPWLTAERRGRP